MGLSDIRIGTDLFGLAGVGCACSATSRRLMPTKRFAMIMLVQSFPTAGLEDLAVGCVVAEEPQLGHDDASHAGAEQLPPAIADPDEASIQAPDQHGADQFGPVVPVPAAHEIPGRERGGSMP